MLRISRFLVAFIMLIGLTAVPGFSQSGDGSAPTQITGCRSIV